MPIKNRRRCTENRNFEVQGCIYPVNGGQMYKKANTFHKINDLSIKYLPADA
jgi:hypothetical protein